VGDQKSPRGGSKTHEPGAEEPEKTSSPLPCEPGQKAIFTSLYSPVKTGLWVNNQRGAADEDRRKTEDSLKKTSAFQRER